MARTIPRARILGKTKALSQAETGIIFKNSLRNSPLKRCVDGSCVKQRKGRLNKTEWVKIAMQRFEGRLLRYTSRFVPESHAREIVQDAFLKLWQQSPETVGDHLAEWLFKVCRNQAVDLLRKEKRLSRMENMEAVEDESQNPEATVDSTRQSSRMLRLIGGLPPEQQEVLRLKFQEDLSYKQISAITGHSVSYVGVLIHTAITRLRQTEVKS